jgi:nitroreductase
MMDNPVVRAMMNRKSIRKYTDEEPSNDVIETIARAAHQAPFAAQMCSLLLSRRRKKNPFHAPLLFTVCVDCHRLERIMARRGWKMVSSDLCMLLFGLQDAILVAENLVIAGESLGMGSCFLGDASFQADRIAKQYGLPKRVFPVVQLAMGYPAEEPPPRPRYPLTFSLFEDKYPEFGEEDLEAAMKVMDEGYLAQDYYRSVNYMVPLEGKRKETFTFDDYSWTEHMSRKWGQWNPSPDELLKPMKLCGFDLTSHGDTDAKRC